MFIAPIYQRWSSKGVGIRIIVLKRTNIVHVRHGVFPLRTALLGPVLRISGALEQLSRGQPNSNKQMNKFPNRNSILFRVEGTLFQLHFWPVEDIAYANCVLCCRYPRLISFVHESLFPVPGRKIAGHPFRLPGHTTTMLGSDRWSLVPRYPRVGAHARPGADLERLHPRRDRGDLRDKLLHAAQLNPSVHGIRPAQTINSSVFSVVPRCIVSLIDQPTTWREWL